MQARLAAVVLNYKSASMTLGAVRALQASERPIDELIVVDNGSADGSVETFERELARITRVQTARNLGFSGGCNAGIQRALEKGADRVLLVNSDARVTAECVATLEAALDRDARLGVVGPRIVSSADPDCLDSIGISYSPWTGRMRHLGFGQRRGNVPDCKIVDGVSGCAMLIRREVFEQVGLFEDAFFFSFEDLDLCLRARKAGFLSACVGTATVLHEGAHSIGKSSPRRLYFATRNHLLLARRALPLPMVPSLLRGGTIAALNLAHALWTSNTPVGPGLSAFATGVRDHLLGRYGEGG